MQPIGIKITKINAVNIYVSYILGLSVDLQNYDTKMSSLRLPRLIRRLTSPKPRRNDPQRRGVAATCPTLPVDAPWLKDPTYHKIVSPSNVQWTMPKIPEGIRRPHYSENGGVSPWDDIIPLALPLGPPEWYDEHLANGMKNAGRRAAESLKYAVSLVKPGITTRQIDNKLTEWAFAHNCYPSSLNYGRFPGSLCTSVNNVLSHGVPNEYLPYPANLIIVNR